MVNDPNIGMTQRQIDNPLRNSYYPERAGFAAGHVVSGYIDALVDKYIGEY